MIITVDVPPVMLRAIDKLVNERRATNDERRTEALQKPARKAVRPVGRPRSRKMLNAAELAQANIIAKRDGIEAGQAYAKKTLAEFRPAKPVKKQDLKPTPMRERYERIPASRSSVIVELLEQPLKRRRAKKKQGGPR